MLLTCGDLHALEWIGPVYEETCRRVGRSIPWVWWMRIDAGPLLPGETVLLRDQITRVIAWNEHARTWIERAVPVMDVPVVGPAVDTEVFHRMDDTIRAELRRAMGLEDRFVVLSVGVNRVRKQLGSLLEAYAVFREGKEGRVALCLHTDPAPPGGLDVRRIARYLGCEDDLVLTNPQRFPGGVPRDQLPFVYNVGDVAVFATAGDGSCLPMLEAMACGLPVIAHDAGALADVDPSGAVRRVPTERVRAANGMGDAELRFHLAGDPCGRARPLVSLSGVVGALEELYADRSARQRRAERGREAMASRAADWDTVSARLASILSTALPS